MNFFLISRQPCKFRKGIPSHDNGRGGCQHVVEGEVMSTDLEDEMEAETVNGQTVMVDLSDGVMINDANVTTADVEATNGVIHIIDTVLVPDDFQLE